MRPALTTTALVCLCTSLLLVCSAGTALAASLVLSADATALPLGSSTQIHVEVQGGQIDAAPRLVNSDGFDVEMAGRSSSFTMRQGRVSQQTTYTFTIIARKAGRHTLGPAEAMVDGKRVISKPLVMQVTASSRAGPGGAASTVPGGSAGGESRWFAQASLSNEHPFEGESIVYVLDVGTAVAVRGTRWDRPSWGTLTPAPGVEPAQSDRLEVIEGRRFEVTTLVMPLVALEAGATRIEPSVMEFTVPQRSRSFFDLGAGRQFSHSSNSLDLTVRPLPQEGRPADFSGAVGRFRLSASIDRARLNAGETVTLLVRLSGSGSLHKPTIDLQLPDTVRRYSEQPTQVSKLIGRSLRTELTLREALVPLQPGTITIPPLSFTYFDPAQEQYQTATTRSVQLHVGGSAVVDPAVVARSAELTRGKEAVEVLGSDLVSLHSEELSRGDQRLGLGTASILLSLLLPLFGFSSVATVVTRRRRSGSSAGRARERVRAAKAALKALHRAAAADDLDSTETAWRAYLSARLQHSGKAISPADAEQWLAAAGAAAELAEGAAQLLERLESVRYGGASAGSLAADIGQWARSAERGWK